MVRRHQPRGERPEYLRDAADIRRHKGIEATPELAAARAAGRSTARSAAFASGISAGAMLSSVTPRPAPPYFGLTLAPSSPCSPKARQSSGAMAGVPLPEREGRVLHDALGETESAPRLVVTIMWDGGGRNVLERWPTAWPPGK